MALFDNEDTNGVVDNDLKHKRFEFGFIAWGVKESFSISSTTMTKVYLIDCRTLTGKKVVHVINNSGESIDIDIFASYNEDGKADIEAVTLTKLEEVLADTAVADTAQSITSKCEPYAWLLLRAARTTGSGAVTFNAYFRGN